eukprot:s4965_g4.t1
MLLVASRRCSFAAATKLAANAASQTIGQDIMSVVARPDVPQLEAAWCAPMIPLQIPPNQCFSPLGLVQCYRIYIGQDFISYGGHSCFPFATTGSRSSSVAVRERRTRQLADHEAKAGRGGHAHAPGQPHDQSQDAVGDSGL